MPKFDSEFLRTNSVPTPRAQCSPCVVPGSAMSAKRTAILRKLETLPNIDVTLRAFLVFFFQYGLRVSELCNVSPGDVDPSGMVFIRGLKGSSDRFLQASFDIPSIVAFRCCKKPFGFFYSRFFIYRFFKKIGVKIYKPNHKNAAVTHAGRHLFAELAADYSSDFGGVADVLGQKSDSSALYYISGYTYKYDEEGNIVKFPVWSKKQSAQIKRGIMSNKIPPINSNIYTDKNGRIRLRD
jgi:integrase